MGVLLGLATVLAALAAAYTLVRLAGAAYLVVLGLRAWWGSRRPTAAGGRPSRGTGHPLRAGLLTNLLNPKIAVFYTGLLPALVPARVPAALALAVLVLVHAALSLAWLSDWAWAAARSSGLLHGPATRRWLERITGTVLIALGLRVAVEAR